MDKINLDEKFQQIQDYWSPRIVGQLNGQQVKLAKIKGTFIWHHHEFEDELFMVVRGEMILRLRDREVSLRTGELFVVPRGVEHQPVADEEAWVLLFEPASTRNTGNVCNEKTVDNPEMI